MVLGCVYRLGIPIFALFVLLKNGDEIRRGGRARQRYAFLVADYKEDFYFWDTLGARCVVHQHIHPALERI